MISTSEKAVLTLFTAGAVTGLGAIIYGIIKDETSVELTPYITTAFLMSISGNCTRILANELAFKFEKIIISAAVLTYAAALSSDYDDSIILALYLKLITTGCVGAWNAAQMVRLNIDLFNDTCRKITQNPIEPTDNKVAIAAFSCYALGAALGYGAFSIGLAAGLSLDNVAPFITFAFLMSHCGNLVRTEFNNQAPFSEKSLIRAAVSFYFIALCCDFSNQPKPQIAKLTKLAAASLVGAWNAWQTWRINKTNNSVCPEPACNNADDPTAGDCSLKS